VLRTQYDACCHISSKIDLVSGLRCILPHICAGELPCCHNLCVLSSRVPTSFQFMDAGISRVVCRSRLLTFCYWIVCVFSV
jgi:hypothetical protein